MNATTAELVRIAVAAAPPVTAEVRARIAALMPPVAGHPPAGPRTPPPPPGPKTAPPKPAAPPRPPKRHAPSHAERRAA